MSYHLSFDLEGLPKIITNGSQGSWRTKWANAKKWKRAVGLEIRQRGHVMRLSRAKLILTRYSSVEPDFDGLVSSFKPIIDGLVEIGVLVNDKSENIGQPEYRWERASPKGGHIRVEVVALEPGECRDVTEAREGLILGG